MNPSPHFISLLEVTMIVVRQFGLDVIDWEQILALITLNSGHDIEVTQHDALIRIQGANGASTQCQIPLIHISMLVKA